jgi:Mce-associated membrane protein
VTTTTQGDDKSARLAIVGLIVSVVALVVALVFAIVLGTGWAHARTESATATTRDDALAGSRQAAINLNSVDSNNLDQTFADIQSSITGDELVNGLNDTKDQFREQFQSSNVVTTATVEHAALVSFDQDENTASSLIVLKTDTKRPDAAEQLFLSTLRLDMTVDGGVWKATKIQPIGQRIPLSGPTDTQAPTDTPAPTDTAAPTDTPAPATPAPATGGQ